MIFPPVVWSLSKMSRMPSNCKSASSLVSMLSNSISFPVSFSRKPKARLCPLFCHLLPPLHPRVATFASGFLFLAIRTANSNTNGIDHEFYGLQTKIQLFVGAAKLFPLFLESSQLFCTIRRKQSCILFGGIEQKVPFLFGGVEQND